MILERSVDMAIQIIKPDEMSDKEANIYVEDEVKRWKAKGKEISKIELAVDGNEVVITATKKSPIKRVRRITGYLSTVDSFNDAKKAELASRVKHIG